MTTRHLVTLLLLAAACGGSVASSSAPSTPCGAYAEAYCQKADECTSGDRINRSWGDMATCVTRETLACTNGLDGPHTGQSVALLTACTSGMSGYSCTDFLDGTLPETCNPTGPGASGAACTFNAQCATGYCSNIRYSTCGTCAEPPASGSSCAESNCGPGMSCQWNEVVDNVCEAYVTAGSSCGAYSNPPCAADLSCAGSSSTTGASGTCVAGATLGEPCGSKNMENYCDGTMGLWCLDDTCTSVSYVGDGQPCGYIGGGVSQCSGGTCYSSAGPYFSYAGPMTGVCKAFAADGAACDTAQGPGCMTGARCVTSGGTAGVCTPPVASVSAACK